MVTLHLFCDAHKNVARHVLRGRAAPGEGGEVVEVLVIQLIEDLDGPSLEVAEVDEDSLGIEIAALDGYIDLEVVAVEILALAADLEGMSSREAFSDRHRIHMLSMN